MENKETNIKKEIINTTFNGTKDDVNTAIECIKKGMDDIAIIHLNSVINMLELCKKSMLKQQETIDTLLETMIKD